MTAGFLFPAFMVTHKGLHNGMVCGIHVGVQREGAFSLAIVRRISFWSYDPVLRPGRETERNGELGKWYSALKTKIPGVRKCESKIKRSRQMNVEGSERPHSQQSQAKYALDTMKFFRQRFSKSDTVGVHPPLGKIQDNLIQTQGNKNLTLISLSI